MVEKVGVFLARMQPIHFGHTYVVEKACMENDRVIVILGSSNKKDMYRNPLSIELRIEMLKESISESIGKEYADKIEVYEIPDWSKEDDYENQKEWGLYLYYNIVSRIETKKFTMYFSDTPEIMLNWFDDDMKTRVSFRFLDRTTVCDGMSATKIRNAFNEGDCEYIKKYCPQPVVRRFNELSELLKIVYSNPKSDFSMV